MKTISVPASKIFIPLALGVLLSFVLIAVRIVWSGSLFYRFMIWNLFLAAVPLVMAYFAVRQTNRFFQAILLSIWLLFFPNALYIITDFFHLYPRDPIPLWYDLAHLALFSWLGIWFGFLSLYFVHSWLRTQMKAWQSWVIVEAVLFLSGYGIYLGRYLRWNSWDILTNPGELFADIFARLAYPTEHPKTWGVTLVFGIIFSVCYAIFQASPQIKSDDTTSVK